MKTNTTIDQQLAAIVAEWSARPFQWGVSDCCQFARSAAWALHGIAVDSPAYLSERSAVRALRERGGYEGLLRSAGLLPRELVQARRGDFVLFHHGEPGLFSSGLALVTGTQAHAPTRIGLLGIDRRQWLQCWGVE